MGRYRLLEKMRGGTVKPSKKRLAECEQQSNKKKKKKETSRKSPTVSLEMPVDECHRGD
jgi:hypothetical protein